MSKITSTSFYSVLGLAIVLVGCSGNNTSTTIGPPAVIDPIKIDKVIAAVDWSKNNEVEMASHAYRAIVRNTMLATVYSGYSATFKGFISLVTGSRDLIARLVVLLMRY